MIFLAMVSRLLRHDVIISVTFAYAYAKVFRLHYESLINNELIAKIEASGFGEFMKRFTRKKD